MVHFEGKEGQIKKLTQDTLEKIIERRKQWLGLTSPYKNFTEVAKTSLEYIPEQPQSFDVNDIAENFIILCVIAISLISVSLKGQKMQTESVQATAAARRMENSGQGQIK